MALPDAQYRTFRDLLRIMLSVEGVPATDGDVLSFYKQLMSDAASGVALSSTRNFLCGEIFRRILSGNASNPSDANLVTFWAQLATDSNAAVAMGTTTSYRAMRNAMRAAISCDALAPTDTDVLGYFLPYAYDWTTDALLLSRWKASNGLADMVSGGAFGALTQPGGAVTVTPSAIDGNSCWSFAKGGTLRLASTNTTPTYNGPVTVITVGRATSTGGAPASLDCWYSSTSGGLLAQYVDASNINVSGGATLNIPITPANWNALDVYYHSTETRYSVNGASYTKGNAGTTAFLNGITIGMRPAGTTPAGFDLAEMIIVEGQMSARLTTAIHAYLRTQYPSLGVAATAPAVFSPNATSLNGLFSAPFDIIVVGGQSNNCNYVTDGPTQAPGANVFMLTNANTVTALTQIYDGATGQLDQVSADGTATMGGNATSLANAYAASTGRPCVIIPCGRGASGFQASGATGGYWNVSYPRGNKLRNSLYGSMLARALNMVALGGTLRFLWWYQGETEAQLGGQASYQASMQTLLDTWATDTGVDRVLIQKISINTPTAPNLTAIRAAQDNLAVANKRIIMPSWDGAMDSGGSVHLGNVGQDTIGAAAAAAALAQTAGTGWY